MKNLILQQIRQLKTQKQKTQTQKSLISTQIVPKEDSCKSQKASSSSSFIGSSAPSSNLFINMTFCFPAVDIDLSPKRVQCMTKSIVFQGGRVVKFNGKQIEETIDYLLVNPKTPLQLILKKVYQKVSFREVLDYNFVLQCVKEDLLLAISNYSLYKNRQLEEKQENEQDKTITLAKRPQKLIKTENYDSKLYRFNAESDIDTDEGECQKEEPEQTQNLQQTKTLMPKSKTQAFMFTQPEQFGPSQPKSELKKRPLKRQAFICQKPKSDESAVFSVNKFICEELMKLQRIYQNQKEVGRKIAYLKAVSAIKSLDKEIESQRDLQNLRGVGKKIINKVRELLHTGKLEKLERLKTNEKRVVIDTLSKIWGVGPNTAEQLYSKGIRSIEQLRKRTDLLNKNQKIGLKYYEDFLEKMPREQVTAVYDSVVQVFKTLIDSFQMYHIEICGSYRRGRSHCGDIDILISRKDGKYERKLLLSLILELQKSGLITDHLVFPSASQTQSSLSYMGVCISPLSPRHRRLDIKYYPIAQYPYALLYFTGSDMFNRSMRLYASKLGIQLSDHAAVPRRRNNNDQFWDKPIPRVTEEKEIFQFLGMEYKTPQERDVVNI